MPPCATAGTASRRAVTAVRVGRHGRADLAMGPFIHWVARSTPEYRLPYHLIAMHWRIAVALVVLEILFGPEPAGPTLLN